MLNRALPRPAGGLPGPFTNCPLPLAPSLRKNHPFGADGVTTKLHPVATTTSPRTSPINFNLRMNASPASRGVPLRGAGLHADPKTSTAVALWADTDGRRLRRLHRRQRPTALIAPRASATPTSG